MITEVVKNSIGKSEIAMSEEAWAYTTKLRDWMFENVYIDSPAKWKRRKQAE